MFEAWGHVIFRRRLVLQRTGIRDDDASASAPPAATVRSGSS